MKKRTSLRTDHELYHADTCEPLKAAADQGGVKLAALGRGSYPGTRLPNDELQEVLMVGYWDATSDQHWGLDWHCNEGLEIGYLSAGKLPFSVNDKAYELKPDDLTITRPWQRHCVGNPHVPANHYSWLILDVGMRRPNQAWKWPDWLLLSEANLKRLTDLLRHNEQPIWHANSEIGHCFERINATLSDETNPSKIIRLKILINELLVLLDELFISKNPKIDESLTGSERTVSLFLDSLDHRLDEPWTLDLMAEACGLGRTQFASYCRKLVNIPPIDFLNQRRIEAAVIAMERHPKQSITDIAFLCGFQSSQYFSKVFRQFHGCTPSDYRNRPLQQNETHDDQDPVSMNL